MKYITYLVMCFVLLLAAPVVWAGQVEQTVDMPEYLPSVALEFSPVVAAHCRDVDPTCKLVYITNQTGADANTFYTLETETWKKAGNIPNGDGYINHKGAAVVTDRTVYLGESQNSEAPGKSNIETSKYQQAGGTV